VSDPIVDLLETEWKIIDDLVSGLEEAQWKAPVALEGWTVQDCVSHVVGVEGSLLGDAPPNTDVGHLTYLQSPFQEIIEVPIQHRRPWTGAEVLADYRDVISRRSVALRAMSGAEMAKVGWSPIGDVPYRDFMGVRLFDCWMHEQDMRRALDLPGHQTGEIAEVALDRFRQAIPFVTARKAEAPAGSATVIHTTGDNRLTWTVTVTEQNGKARGALSGETAADAPADAITTITLPFTTLVALGGGRWSAEQAHETGDITVEGDEALGERILTNLAFTP